jgi:hypothetical protein
MKTVAYYIHLKITGVKRFKTFCPRQEESCRWEWVAWEGQRGREIER